MRKLGRTTKERMRLFRNLASQLVKHERIVTTLAKGKELRRIGDNVITLGKRDNSYSRHEARWWMREVPLVSKLFTTLKERYAERNGGYTRLLRAPNRKSDNAPMAVVELVDNPFPPLRPSKEEWRQIRNEMREKRKEESRERRKSRKKALKTNNGGIKNKIIF